MQELIEAKEVEEDIQYLLAKNEELVDQMNAIEMRSNDGHSGGDVNVNFSGLAESVADLLMTMSKSSNGSIVINKPETQSVSLLRKSKISKVHRNCFDVRLLFYSFQVNLKVFKEISSKSSLTAIKWRLDCSKLKLN